MRDENLARLLCLNHNLPTTESRYAFIQVLIFLPLKCEARKLTMQYVHETYIVPALKFNIIIVATAAHSIAMLYQGVAVAVFPTYMEVYVACACVLDNTRACRSSSIKRVNSCSGPCPSAPADQATPSPSPRSPCCAWRRPDCRRKN